MGSCELRTPTGRRTSRAWTLYEIATASEPIDRWTIMRRRSLRVGAKAIGWHLRELLRAGYVEVASVMEERLNEHVTIRTQHYRATTAGLEALNA